MTTVERIKGQLDKLNDEEKAKLAGLLLSDINPNLENLAHFWSELEGSVKAELESRIQGGHFD